MSAPVEADVAGVHVEVGGAVGAQWLPYVGDASDVVRYDAVATETVRVVPAAVELGVSVPMSAWEAGAGLRIEEGTVHAGGLEAAEARAWVARPFPSGEARAWVGRADLPLTGDRGREIEELTFSQRPVLSRSILPLHATGIGLDLDAAPVSAGLGASYASLTSDAPWLWARADVHPWGALPDVQGEPLGEGPPRVDLGGGIARLDSASLGEQWCFAGDLALAWRGIDVDGGYVRAVADSARDEILAGIGARVARFGPHDVHLAARGERITGLEDGEDARWVMTGRAALRLADQRAVVYVEATHSAEVGTAVADGEDVVVLDASIERPNDSVAIGLLFRP